MKAKAAEKAAKIASGEIEEKKAPKVLTMAEQLQQAQANFKTKRKISPRPAPKEDVPEWMQKKTPDMDSLKPTGRRTSPRRPISPKPLVSTAHKLGGQQQDQGEEIKELKK